jgi:hypothetical protein
MDFDLEAGIAVLERTPKTLRAMLDGLPSAWTESIDGPNTWSAYDVVGHLLHGEVCDWIPRAEIILGQGENRRFKPFDREAMFRESEGKSLPAMLDEFEAARAKSLETLKGWKLTPSQLDLTGEHPAFGTVQLRQLLSTWVAHDLGHLVQINRTMARQYRDAIGPWQAYLSVMK